MLANDMDGIIICGKRKRGKTTLTKQMYENEKRVCLYDAKGELTEPIGLRAGETCEAIWSDKGVLRLYVKRTTISPWQELEWSAHIAITMGQCIYVVDELPDALEDKEPGPCWKWVTRMGRKKDIRFVYTFQRAAEVPPMARANAQDWYLFQTNEANDIDYIARSVSKAGASIVRGLKRGEALWVRDGDVQGVVTTIPPKAGIINDALPK